MELTEMLKDLAKDSLVLHIKDPADSPSPHSHFGGLPLVPEDFQWPFYETDTFDDDEVKPRPLSFLMQINCEELPQTQGEDSLPEKGILLFFYELGSQKWGFDPKDKGCARVYWFEDTASLSPASFPQELPEEYRLPCLAVSVTKETDYPDFYDFGSLGGTEDYDAYQAAADSLGFEISECCSKLLGWANVIQSDMTAECEMASQGYYMGGPYSELPEDILAKARETAPRSWTLLFQLDTVESVDFTLMFGDCGRLYFYIRHEDLKKRNFDRTWLIMQCC